MLKMQGSRGNPMRFADRPDHWLNQPSGGLSVKQQCHRKTQFPIREGIHMRALLHAAGLCLISCAAVARYASYGAL
jgi:hypothetical protein